MIDMLEVTAETAATRLADFDTLVTEVDRTGA